MKFKFKDLKSRVDFQKNLRIFSRKNKWFEKKMKNRPSKGRFSIDFEAF